MKQNWALNELEVKWSLTPEETDLVAGKAGANQLGFSILLKFFCLKGKFPKSIRDIPKQAIDYLTQLLKAKTSSLILFTILKAVLQNDTEQRSALLQVLKKQH